MNSIIGTIKTKWGFLYPYFIVVAFGIIVLTLFSKSDLHIWSNQHHSPFFDIFFSYLTILGDGAFIVIISALLFFWKIRAGILVFSTYAISGILVQILKRIIGAPRPKLFFEESYDLYFIEGIEIHTNNSFPSGHSASAFALFLCFAIMVQNKWAQIAFFAIAALTAYSRIYLSQHFLIDVTVGSAFGIIVTLLCSGFMEKYYQEWMDKPVYNVFQKEQQS